MNVIDMPKRDPYDFIVGPFEEYRVRIEGRCIPGLTAVKQHDGRVSLIVDGRFSTIVPADIAHDVAWLLAQALAVGSGYAFLGAESKEKPFAPQMAEIKS